VAAKRYRRIALRLAISAVGKTAPTILTGAQLLALPREKQPGEDGEAKGWSLTTLLAQAGIKAPSRMRLTDAAGMNLTLELTDFDAASSVPFVKLNKQGSLRFRVFKKKGDAWAMGADLRGLVSIELLK
jgi:hypothetical protein